MLRRYTRNTNPKALVHQLSPCFPPLTRAQALTLFNSICQQQQCRFSSSNNSKGPSDEEKEDLAREQQLRQKFVNKMGKSNGGFFQNALNNMQQQAQAASANAAGGAGGAPGNPQKPPSFGELMNMWKSAGSGNTGGGGQTGGTPPPPGGGTPGSGPGGVQFQRPSLGQSMYNGLLLTMALYALVIMYQLNKEGSPLNQFSGVPWWAEPIDVTVNFLLMRVLLPFRKQRELKMEYEVVARNNPSMTFSQFLHGRYPDLFNGNRITNDQLVAALCACFAASHDLSFAATMQKAVRGTRDTAAAVDKIFEALQREFPHVFSPAGGGGGGSPPAPQQSMGGMGYSAVAGGYQGSSGFTGDTLATSNMGGGSMNFGGGGIPSSSSASSSGGGFGGGGQQQWGNPAMGQSSNGGFSSSS